MDLLNGIYSFYLHSVLHHLHRIYTHAGSRPAQQLCSDAFCWCGPLKNAPPVTCRWQFLSLARLHVHFPRFSHLSLRRSGVSSSCLRWTCSAQPCALCASMPRPCVACCHLPLRKKMAAAAAPPARLSPCSQTLSELAGRLVLADKEGPHRERRHESARAHPDGARAVAVP